MISLLFVFSLFFEKLEISEGHPLGNVNIFNSHQKCQLRFRDYLENSDKVHWAFWLGQRNPNAVQMCIQGGRTDGACQGSFILVSLARYVVLYFLAQTRQLSEQAPHIPLPKAGLSLYLCFCLYCIVLLGMDLLVYLQVLYEYEYIWRSFLRKP